MQFMSKLVKRTHIKFTFLICQDYKDEIHSKQAFDLASRKPLGGRIPLLWQKLQRNSFSYKARKIFNYDLTCVAL